MDTPNSEAWEKKTIERQGAQFLGLCHTIEQVQS